MIRSLCNSLRLQKNIRPINMTDGHVREYVKRVASVDLENYPQWDLTKPLPKLPVPDLQTTLDTYMAVMKSVLTSEEHTRTSIIVNDFRKPGGLGEVLQEKLKKIAEGKDNWSYNWWLDDMYMKIRLPLPINSNPAMVFPKQNFIDRDQQLRYAARLISGILDYKTIIDARGLPVDRCRHKEKGQPLCMSQYYRLFTSYRVPGVKKDHLTTSTSRTIPDSQHIVVICKNQFFVLDVIINCSRLSEDDIFTQLDRIAGMADGSESVNPVGILTTAYRDKWAQARTKLLEAATNQDSLKALENSLFLLCLDKQIPISFNHQRSIDETSMNIRDDVSLMLQMLHGQGSNANSCNRWYDKTMQFIISRDGACGLNYEHSPSEGIAVVQLIEHLLKYMQEVHDYTVKKRLHRTQSIGELPRPKKLYWNVDDDVKNAIVEAKSHIERLIKDFDLYVYRFEDFGREFPKMHNMSPDSFIQLALQLTYYKIHGHLVSTYESASTRRFRNGRVDNIRANSPAALDWVQSMVGRNDTPFDEKMRLLQRAMEWQTQIMTQTILGHGMDSHLLGLREVAAEAGMPVPDLFTDQAYKRANHFTLSTSQVPTTMDDAFMCYGPVVPDGYGICYNPHPHNIVVCISAFKSNAETQSDFFASTLESSLLQMQELCIKASEPGLQDSEKLRHAVTMATKNGPVTNGNSPAEHHQPVKEKHVNDSLQRNGPVSK